MQVANVDTRNGVLRRTLSKLNLDRVFVSGVDGQLQVAGNVEVVNVEEPAFRLASVLTWLLSLGVEAQTFYLGRNNRVLL